MATHYTLGATYSSTRPLLVTLVNQTTGKKYSAFIFTEGGYDWTVMEGAPVGEPFTGMFLGTDSRDPCGKDYDSGEWVKDTECIWNLHEPVGSMPAGNYKILLDGPTPDGVYTTHPDHW